MSKIYAGGFYVYGGLYTETNINFKLIFFYINS